MDILLNDIRLASPESSGSGAPVPEIGAPFAAVLRDMPQGAPNTAGDARLPATEDLQTDNKKFIEMNNLDEVLAISDELEDMPGSTAQQSVSVPTIAAESRPESVPAAVAFAVRRASVSAPGADAQTIAVTQPNAPLTGQTLPPRGSGLPPAAQPPAVADESATGPASQAQLPETGIRPAEQPAAMRDLRVVPLSNVSTRSASAQGLSAETNDTGHGQDQVKRTLRVRVAQQPAVPARPLPVDSLQSAPQSPPASVDTGQFAAGKLDSVVSGRPLAGPDTDQQLRPLPPTAEPGLEADAERVAPVRADIGQSRSQADPRIALMPAAPATTVPVEAPELRSAENGTRFAPAADGWPQARLEGNRIARADLRPVDAGLIPEAVNDSLSAIRDSLNPISRSAEPLPISLQQANIASAMTPVSFAAGLTPAAPGHSVLPQPLETLTLARDATPSDWGDGIGERVSWLVNHKQNSASIRLDPPALGRLDVQIRVADDATTITIQTQQLQTRDLIDAAVPRLREFLQDAGMQNVNVDVSHRQDQQLAQGQRDPEARGTSADDALADAPDEQLPDGFPSGYRSDGLVDTFA